MDVKHHVYLLKERGLVQLLGAGVYEKFEEI